MKRCIFKKLKANRVNLWHTCYLGVLRGAELESAVCPAQKWLISPKKMKNPRWPPPPHGRNMNKVCFCMFSNMRN